MSLGALDDELRRLPADRCAVDADRRQRRVQVGSELEVAEADDGESLRDRDAGDLCLCHDTQREKIRAAEDGVGSVTGLQQLDEGRGVEQRVVDIGFSIVERETT